MSKPTCTYIVRDIHSYIFAPSHIEYIIIMSVAFVNDQAELFLRCLFGCCALYAARIAFKRSLTLFTLIPSPRALH